MKLVKGLDFHCLRIIHLGKGIRRIVNRVTKGGGGQTIIGKITNHAENY